MMIDITGVDLVKFAQKVYELSVLRGLGFLHATAGGLTDADAAKLIEPEGRIALSMDYVRGRGCKMVVFREGGRLSINAPWYDHTQSDLAALLSAFGLTPPTAMQHGVSCACRECEGKRS